MATITREGDFFDKTGSSVLRYFLYNGPTSYTTGGETLLPEQLALGRINILLLEPASNGTVILVARYSRSQQKISWFDYAGNEIANGTNLALYGARGVAFGH